MPSTTRIPWRFKIAAKILLSRMPVSFDFWRRVNLFRHGQMNTGDYARRVFHRHCDVLIESGSLAGATLLELGPGDGIATGLLAHAHGAAHTYLIDVDDFAEKDVAVYQGMLALWERDGVPMGRMPGCGTFDELCEVSRTTYFTSGLLSLRDVPDNSVDHAFSQAVLEHVRLSEFANTIKELRRVLKPGGTSTHRVDLKDHLGGALNHLRFSEERWESPLFADSGFYTNRIRFQEMIEIIEGARFEVTVMDKRSWPSLPTPRAKLWDKFRDLPEDDLLVSGFDVLMR